MIDVNSTYIIVQYIIGKEINGNFSPSQINAMLPTAEDDFFRSISRPQADQFHAWNVLKPAVDDLRLHTLKKNASLVFVNGLATIPTDFRDWLSFGFTTTFTDNCDVETVGEVPVEVVKDDEWATRLSASIRKPTLGFPILKFNATQFQIAPVTATPMRLTYYKIPAKPFWANQVPILNDTPVYDANASTQSEYPEICQSMIINILLRKVGVNLSYELISQYANEAKAQV